MTIRSIAVATCATAALLAAFPAAAACKLSAVAIPVTVSGAPGAPAAPMVEVKVNGKPGLFLIASGAAVNTISAKYAASQKLAPSNGIVTVAKFEVAGSTLTNAAFARVDQVEAGADGVLGQTLLHQMDVEYDLPDGKVLLAKADGCENSNMVHWPTKDDISVMPLLAPANGAPLTETGILVNGVVLRALFDTASPFSVITEAAAAKAGVKTTDPGVAPMRGAHGQWLGQFTVNVGGEEVKNAPLEIAATKDSYYDVLIGADYFKTHHLYVAYGQNKIYATRAGFPNAPVFTAHQPTPTGMDNSAQSRGRLLTPAEQ